MSHEFIQKFFIVFSDLLYNFRCETFITSVQKWRKRNEWEFDLKQTFELFKLVINSNNLQIFANDTDDERENFRREHSALIQVCLFNHNVLFCFIKNSFLFQRGFTFLCKYCIGFNVKIFQFKVNFIVVRLLLCLPFIQSNNCFQLVHCPMINISPVDFSFRYEVGKFRGVIVGFKYMLSQIFLLLMSQSLFFLG